MKTEINRKMSYEAPRIEAASFMTEQGYAASAPQTSKFTIGVSGGSL
ncbi:MAG: hypothetical protein MJZ78_06100 [Bacteroidales bacterium]|nr:hypothetical protein [Bacteroidales bacterium]